MAIFSQRRSRARPDVAAMAATVGVITLGAALFEAALIPGLLIGAAAVLAPNLASNRLPKLRRGLQTWLQRPEEPAKKPAPKTALAVLPRVPAAALRRFRLGRALTKTVTYRVTMATAAFSWDYIVLGELATAAGLSALSLAAGPVFYFLHEAAWNFYASPDRQGSVSRTLSLRRSPSAPPEDARPLLILGGVAVDQTVAKTAVYEVVSTTAEFGVNFLVVGDVVTAAIITAPIAVLGPFIYFGHEKLWDYVAARSKSTLPASTAFVSRPADGSNARQTSA